MSSERIRSLMRELAIDGYFETSAREGRNIAELVDGTRLAVSRSKAKAFRAGRAKRGIR